MFKKIFPLLRDIAIVIGGNIIYACGVAFFILPGGLITGGTTGIALFIQHLFGVPISTFVLCFNAVMFFMGLLVLGRKFAATTILSTFVYPIALEMIQRLSNGFVITTDPVLCTVFGGLCIGTAIGIVIRTGASTGGMDIPPLVLNKLFRLPVSVTMYLFDFVILILQAFSCTGEEVLYGILLILIYTIVLDKCLMIGTEKVEIKVISHEHERIRQEILSVVSSREVGRVRKLVHSIDSSAFLIISRVTEVRGRGFTQEKEYK